MTEKRVAFVTTGQAPRTDVVPEMLAEIGRPLDAVQVGLLDDLSRAEIAALAPAAGAPVIVSRLRDGSEVAMDHRKVAAGLAGLIERLDGERFDVLVLLCTGAFPELRARTVLVKAGPVVDGMVEALAPPGGRIGVLVPAAAQVDKYRGGRIGLATTVAAHASPYLAPRWREAVGELSTADLIVMHCMGYDRAMRLRVAELSGKPVLLARSLVAMAVAQLL